MSEPSSENPESDCGEAGEWLSASETYSRILTATSSHNTHIAIAQRAHAGLLRAKALMMIVGQNRKSNSEVARHFWWAGGHAALKQDWQTGDFETWVDERLHLRALGVSFHLGDLQKCFPDVFKPDLTKSASTDSVAGKAGRPAAEWWDDLWVEICRGLYIGDLKPKRQADIEKAMNDWIASTGNSAATSTIRARARKLWQAISREDEN